MHIHARAAHTHVMLVRQFLIGPDAPPVPGLCSVPIQHPENHRFSTLSCFLSTMNPTYNTYANAVLNKPTAQASKQAQQPPYSFFS